MVDMRGDYQCQLINPNGDQLDLLSMTRVVQLNYSRVLNDVGTFSLTLSANDDAAQHFGLLDMIVNVWRKNTPTGDYELDASYLTRYFGRLENEDDNTEYVVFGGYSLEHLLTRRVIVPPDDPVNAGGFVTRQGAGDTVMRDFVLYQCVTPAVNALRTITGLTVAAVVGTYDPTFQRRSYENLLEVLKEISQKSMVDFRIVYTGDVDSSTMSFEFQATTIGTDKTKTNNYPTGAFLLFDPKRGNMHNPSITVDRKDEKTFAYVAGQGLEDERVVFPVVNANTVTLSIWNRCEIMTDARNNEAGDTDGFLSAGVDTLNDNKAETQFDFTPDLAAPSMLYNVDWLLGDKITAAYASYTEDLRIKSITINVQEDEEITIELANANVL